MNIYILWTTDGYRVIRTSGIEQIYEHTNSDGWNPFEVWSFFHSVAIHASPESALLYARTLGQGKIETLDHHNLPFPSLSLAEFETYQQRHAALMDVQSPINAE